MSQILAPNEEIIRPVESGDAITAGSVLRSVVYLAAPNVATLLLTSFNTMADAFFVGHLGSVELAAVGQARRIVMFLMVFVVAITSGTTALVARFTGARDRASAILTTQQSLRITLLLSLITIVPLWCLRYQAMVLIGAKPAEAQLGSVYLAITFATTTVMFMNLVLMAIFRGTGQMRTLMMALMTMDTVNIVLAYLLIYGVGPWRGLRVAGAALAAALSRLIPVVWLTIALWKSELREALQGNWLQCDFGWVRRILRIGAPQIIGTLAFNIGGMGVLRLLNEMPDATHAIAAFTFGVAFESLSFMPGFAFNIATATLVGQNLGARKPQRAAQCARIAMWLAAGIMGAVGVLLFVGAHAISVLSGKDPQVIAICTTYLRISAFCQPLLGVAMVLWGALQGAGDTQYSAYVSVLCNFVLRIVAIWLFGVVFGLGSVAVWVILSASWVVACVLLELRFRSGKWQRVRV